MPPSAILSSSSTLPTVFGTSGRACGDMGGLSPWLGGERFRAGASVLCRRGQGVGTGRGRGGPWAAVRGNLACRGGPCFAPRRKTAAPGRGPPPAYTFRAAPHFSPKGAWDDDPHSPRAGVPVSPRP